MMRKMFYILVLATILFCACSCAGAQAQVTTTGTQNNVLQVATAEGNLKTFTGAVDAAGMRDTLGGVGPYTIFAPTDDAFKAVDTPTMSALNADQSKMSAVLKNHVVAGRYTIKDLRNMGYVTTLDGKTLTVQSSNGAFAVDGAHIIKNDVPAGNGIIHVIDTVMIPK